MRERNGYKNEEKRQDRAHSLKNYQSRHKRIRQKRNFSGKDELHLTCLNLSCKKLIHHIQEKSGAKNPITLRDTVAREDDAVSYFHMMQTMLNGYFSSPVFCNISLEEKMDLPGIICSTLVRAPELVQIVQGTIAAAAIINEFIAVIAAKKGFELAGEIHKA